MTDIRPKNLESLARKSLADPDLRAAVHKATAASLGKRERLVADIPHWESLRAEAHRIRREVIEHLGDYLEAFEASSEREGIRVHWARDAAEACRIVLAIARTHGATEAVKSKSMVTEEIGLGAFLEQNGVASVETDLGEYIVQLAEEMPSHLTAPALHLSRQAIGRLFADKLGVPYTDDPEALIALASARLRARFLSAGLGITGANFGLAREGGIVVVENECNAALTMNLPRVHVAVMGIERLLPSLDDLPLFLKLLPISATGQKMTSYVSYVRGPRGKDDGGPKEVHVVLVDNGRTRILNDPANRDLLNCIRCGACLNVCPVYQRIGGHAYGWVYQGPIGATLIPFFRGLREGRHVPFASSLCGACHDICPVRIDIPRHLLRLRHDVVRAGNASAIDAAMLKAWARAARHPVTYRAATAALRALGRLGGGRLLRAWNRTRDVPPLAARPFSSLWKEEERKR